MDSHRFDAFTRRLVAAGSRRQMLTALVAGALGHMLHRSDAAACKGYNAKCKSNSSCCGSAGLRCDKQGKHGKRRCRCKPGWKRCAGAGNGCLPVSEDPANCGACGNQCPPATPCCFGGQCQELCDGACCADCFVEILGNGQPAPNSDVCCLADGGTICGPDKKKTSDDRCCYQTEECINGACCSANGALGSVVCGGECCSSAACCNGGCCDNGKVCATTAEGVQCVSASRACGPGDPACFAGEVCHGGVCCAGQRVCSIGLGNDVCCAADERCELPGTAFAMCCPVNTTCNSYKGHRVRR